MPRRKGGAARALAAAVDTHGVCSAWGWAGLPKHGPGWGHPGVVQHRDEGTTEHACHSPAPQSSPVLPGGHRHRPVTLSHGAPLQEQEPEQFTPNVPAGHSWSQSFPRKPAGHCFPHSPLTGSQSKPGGQTHACRHPGPKKPGSHSAGGKEKGACRAQPAPRAPPTPLHSPSWHRLPLKPALQRQLPSRLSHACVFRCSHLHSSEQPGPKAHGGQAAPTEP